MPYHFADFHPSGDIDFEPEARFISEDGHEVRVVIRTRGQPLEEAAVVLVNDFLAREKQIHQQVAGIIFAKESYLMDFLEYDSAEALQKALQLSYFHVDWDPDMSEIMFIYFSPLDDLEDESKEKHIVVGAFEEGDLDNLDAWLDVTA